MSWIAFIDESGDHGLENIDPASTMFALTAAVYRKRDYLEKELPQIAAMKHHFWSHEGVVLHGYDISKKLGPFSRCIETAWRTELYTEISALFDKSPAKLIAAVIDKARHKAQYVDPSNVYFLAVQFVLERIYMMTGADVTIVFESRGRAENRIVRGWCDRICGGENYGGQRFGFGVHFATKESNVGGLQMSDLACQPIIAYVQNPSTKRPDWLA